MKKLVLFIAFVCTIIGGSIMCGCNNNVPTAETPHAEPRYYNAEYVAGEGGTISGEATQTVEEGENSTEVIAVPNAGYKFVKWSDGVETAERTDKNVTASISVTATFERLSYTIKYLTGGDGYIRGLENQTLRE